MIEHLHPRGDAVGGRDHRLSRHPGHHARPHAPRQRRDAQAGELERAINEAEAKRVGSSLDVLIARYPRRRGTPANRALLEKRRIGANITKEELEHRFVAFLDANDIERPLTNRWMRLDDGTWIEADCHWPAANLIVEHDGGAAHHWRQLHEDPRTLASELRRLLSARP